MDYYAFVHGASAPYIRERLKPSRPRKSLIHWYWGASCRYLEFINR